MITIKFKEEEFTIKPTRFPDGTSQVWLLPSWVENASYIQMRWFFEEEREIVDLISAKTLINSCVKNNTPVYLYMPFLPYSRQDKEVGNDKTFNLRPFASVINSLNFTKVQTLDVHNLSISNYLIHNFKNIHPAAFVERAIKDTNPDYVVFPDTGAEVRYAGLINSFGVNNFACKKTRCQLTGQITGYELNEHDVHSVKLNDRFLIVDDICDGGATFISAAKTIKAINPNAKVYLYVTHGIFSKGKDHLLNNGIDAVYTTNSLIKNKDGYEV